MCLIKFICGILLITSYSTFSDCACQLCFRAFSQTFTQAFLLFVLKISTLGDSQEPDDAQGGRRSPTLLDHTHSSDDNTVQPPLLLEEVDLHSNRLTKLPSWLFFRFQYLRHVDASHNQIDSLPLAIWACSSLVELTLSHNHLSSLSCADLESVCNIIVVV